jgi:1-acyl-sn-glycerol-3-phosphate acyltransferase
LKIATSRVSPSTIRTSVAATVSAPADGDAERRRIPPRQITARNLRAGRKRLRGTVLSLSAAEADERPEETVALFFLHDAEADVTRLSPPRRPHDESRQRQRSGAACHKGEFDLASRDNALPGIPDCRAADAQVLGGGGDCPLVQSRHADFCGDLEFASAILAALNFLDVVGVSQGHLLPRPFENHRMESVETLLPSADYLHRRSRLERAVPLLDPDPEAAGATQEEGADADVEIAVGNRNFRTRRYRITGLTAGGERLVVDVQLAQKTEDLDLRDDTLPDALSRYPHQQAIIVDEAVPTGRVLEKPGEVVESAVLNTTEGSRLPSRGGPALEDRRLVSGGVALLLAARLPGVPGLIDLVPDQTEDDQAENDKENRLLRRGCLKTGTKISWHHVSVQILDRNHYTVYIDMKERTDKRRMPVIETLLNGAIRALLRVACVIRMNELDNIPMKGPAILVTNHTTNYEGPIYYVLLSGRPMTALGKRELWNNPITRFVMQVWGVIPIDRRGADRRAMSRAVRALREGQLLGIAPEGTRSPEGVLQRGRPGAAMIATAMDVPIIPMVQWGVQDLLTNLRRFRRTPIHFRVGEPFFLVTSDDGSAGGDSHRRNLRVMADEIMYQLAVLMPEELRGHYRDLSAMTTTFIRRPQPGE